VTTIVRWTPFRELDTMVPRMRRVFEEASFASRFCPPRTCTRPPTSSSIELEVPGYEEKELGIEVSDHTVTVTGARADSTEETEKAHKVEISKT
jgi:HSP20 family molecular chaperone IbpA